MNLAKTSLLSLIATFVNILSGLVINKAVSIWLGPSGLALLGQFRNFTQLIMTFANGAINRGVVKYTAEYRESEKELREVLSTSFFISVCASSVVGLLLFFFNEIISELIFKTAEYSFVFIIFSVTVVLFVLNSFLLSVINGLKEIRKLIAIKIIQSIYSLILTTLLIVLFGLEGALIAMVTNQSVIFVFTLSRVRKVAKVRLEYFLDGPNKLASKKLGQFVLMTLASAAALPLSHVLVRSHITETVSLDAAGYWQAVVFISQKYLLVATTTLSIYYLPRLSEIFDNLELKKEVLNGYKIILPVAILASTVIYFMREIIVLVMFDDSFLPVVELFMWQIIGDVLKIASFLFSFLMVAKAMSKVFIFSELLFSFQFVILCVFFVDAYGVVGATYAYALNYLFYLIFCYFVFRRYVNR